MTGQQPTTTEWVRDRDARGRPRNQRARDALGRPLPHGAAGVAQEVPPYRGPTEAISEAQRLLIADQPFQAHEVFEDAWKAGPSAEGDLWRGLAQLAVGVTHVKRGNTRGAVALLERAADRLAPFADHPPHGLDIAGVRRWVHRAAAEIEAGGTLTSAPRLTVDHR